MRIMERIMGEIIRIREKKNWEEKKNNVRTPNHQLTENVSRL